MAVTRRKTVGIIGDGQLGWMLAQAGRRCGIGCVVLSEDPGSPAAQAASDVVLGNRSDPVAIQALCERTDVITWEREDLTRATLSALREGESAGLVHCRPGLDALELLQHKGRQKQWLAEHGLATLLFHIVSGDPAEHEAAVRALGYPLIQKSLLGGFDGRGVKKIEESQGIAALRAGPSLLEAHAGRFSELAVMVARGVDGSLKSYSPVAMTFNEAHAVLEYVFAPATLSAELLDRATRLAESAVERLGGVGVFGVEMFLLEDGSVVINEIAGRVHNAGHYTMDGCETSQFEQHLRAVAGLPLGPVTQRQITVMRNLLADDTLGPAAGHRTAGAVESAGNPTIYWYGKAPAPLMRKIGHINGTAATLESARRAVDKAYARLTHSATAASGQMS